MKQIINITLLTVVLSIPFALSQTRKAIPAGRYEALSGVKISHSKGNDGALGKDSQGLFWSEVSKHIPPGQEQVYFFSALTTDSNLKTLLASIGVLESKTFDSNVHMVLSDDLDRDREIFKKLKGKGALIVLKDAHSLKEVLANLPQFEVVLYQAENDLNYFLLKQK